MQSRLNDLPLALTFDDLSLVPSHSTIKSRKEPDVSTVIGKLNYKIPVISSPMNTVTEEQMMWRMNAEGGCSVLHRYMSIEKQIEKVKSMKYMEFSEYPFYVAVGATGDFLERAKSLYNVGVQYFCVDVANGHSQTLLGAVESLKKALPEAVVMAGNVCSYDGTLRLADRGVDVIRCGIGNGSRCITRIVTGHGVPQMTTLEECWRVKATFPNVALVCDGGIRNSGDAIKALVFSDAVMLGNLLAGTDETPGEIFRNPMTGENFKDYAGMASEEARSEWFDREATSFVPEGVSSKVAYRGSVYDVLQKLIGGIKVGMSYCNARTLEELRQNAKFVRITPSGHTEGLPRI